MKLLSTLSIKARLTLVVGVTTAALLAIGILGMSGMRQAADTLELVYEDQLVPTGQLGQLLQMMEENRAQLVLALQHDPVSEFAPMHNHPLSMHTDIVDKNIEKISELWAHVMPHLKGPEQAKLAEEFTTLRQVFVAEGLEPAVAKLQAGEYRAANLVILQQVNPSFSKAHEAAKRLLQSLLDSAQASHEEAEQRTTFMLTAFVTLLVAGVGLSVLQAFFTIRGVNNAVHQIDTVVTQLADGNLSARSGYARNDELGHIARAVDRMAETFKNTVQELTGAIADLTTAAEETSAVTEQTSSGIRQQQSETEQVATAMNEMNATVHEVASNAVQAASAAHNADEQAANGRRVVSQTIEAMDALATEVEKAAEVIHSLESESESIGTVLDVIRGIAEQTNLLALNAAIEAARAGEQGRGFAVVADEVRTLAQRTQQSTQEIQVMIERLQGGARNAVQVMEAGRNRAQAGVDQAAQAGTSLEAITEAVTRINDMNTQIASAAEQQSAVAEEINRNISNISQIAEQTSEGSQQTAAASETLARLAEELQALVSRFRL